jgi:hypothetical protein
MKRDSFIPFCDSFQNKRVTEKPRLQRIGDSCDQCDSFFVKHITRTREMQAIPSSAQEKRQKSHMSHGPVLVRSKGVTHSSKKSHALPKKSHSTSEVPQWH